MIGSGNMPSPQIKPSWLHRGKTIRPCHQRWRASWSTPSHIPVRADWQRKNQERSVSKCRRIIIWLGSRVARETSQRSGVKCSSLERHKVTPRCTTRFFFTLSHSELDTHAHAEASSRAVTHANRNTRSCGFQYLKAEIGSVWKELRDWSAAMYVWARPGTAKGSNLERHKV